MTITKQQLVDKYNEVYGEDNGVDKPFVELTKDEKVEALLQFITEGTGGGGGSGDASAANQTTQIAQLGSLTETAPATDTASSGLNGRLQRITQRITSLISLFPTSLGTKTAAESLSVTPASDATFTNVATSIVHTETQLTAPDQTTTSRQLTGYRHAAWQIVVANINTSITLRFEGSNDNTNWSNLDTSKTDKTITANNVYEEEKTFCNFEYVRVKFVSESGGTSATIDIKTRLMS